jgi:type IX secretion system PorP/SprF family membrane protein
MKLSHRIKIAAIILTTLVVTLNIKPANAQLTGFHSQYFQNEYLANPAMAGMEKGLNLNLGYQQQWTTVPGGPKLQNLTADYNSGNRVGLGINVNSDQAGLISRTRAMLSYAYHLPLSGNDNKLNFGLSLGINDTYIDYNKIVGDAGDVEAQSFNNRSVYIDGDVGISYTSSNLTLQGTLPNLKSVFFPAQGENLDVDRSTFFSAVSYKMIFDNQYNSFTVEPKVAFRGVKGFDNIVDAGVNLAMANYHFNLSGIYHTNQTVTFGAGLDLQTTVLLFAYTNNTGALRSYANNTFEFGLRLKLFNK